MTQKEKIELKLEILNDVRSCMSFNFNIIDETLNLYKLNDIISKYENILEEMELNNEKL